MFIQLTDNMEISSSDSYQLIKDEQLSSIVISSQILAGSCIALSTYRKVIFSDCIFYACDFKGVTFDNCIFENCSFQFSHIKKCQFKNCNFTNCNWKASSSINSNYEDCDLGSALNSMALVGNNNIFETHASDYTTDIYIELARAS